VCEEKENKNGKKKYHIEGESLIATVHVQAFTPHGLFVRFTRGAYYIKCDAPSSLYDMTS
jgi:hypothetical protein